MQTIKIVIEKHTNGYVAYLVELKGVIVGEGDTYQGALANVKSAVAFHVDSFGKGILDNNELPVIELFVAEIAMAS